MAVVTAGTVYPLDFTQIDLTSLLDGNPTVATGTRFVVDYGLGDRDEFTGVNFTYNSAGDPTGGTITGYVSVISSTIAGTITGLSVPVSAFVPLVVRGDNAGAVNLFLSGADLINGSPFSDLL